MSRLKSRFQTSWIDKLPSHVRDIVKESMSTMTLNKGQSVYSAGDIPQGVYQVTKGKIKFTSYTHSGKELVLSVSTPPLTFGEVSLISEDPSIFNAVAMTTTTVSMLAKNRFDQLRNEHPEINHLLLKNSYHRQMWIYKILVGATTLDLRERLAGRLNILAHSIGDPLDDGAIMIPVKQEDLANMLGATRQSINPLLCEWESDGYLSIVYGGVKLLDLHSISGIYLNETDQ